MDEDLLFEIKTGPLINKFVLLGLHLFDTAVFLQDMKKFMHEEAMTMFESLVAKVDFRTELKVDSFKLRAYNDDGTLFFTSKDAEETGFESKILSIRQKKVAKIHKKINKSLKTGFM